MPQRRTLRFSSLDDMLADARQVVASPHTTTGQWTAAQILDHIARAIDCSLDGFGFSAPLWIRMLVRPFRNGVLVRPMRAGFRLPRRGAVLLPQTAITLDDALARLETSAARLKTENAEQPHPVLGSLTPEEYRLLHLRHAELHLSFILPSAT
jgi:hypothetical protein